MQLLTHLTINNDIDFHVSINNQSFFVSRFVLSIWVNGGIPGYLDKGGGGGGDSSTSTVYYPGIVRVTGESRDTWRRGGGGVQYFYCMAGGPSLDCQGNWRIPGYFDKGGGEKIPGRK